MCVCVPRVAVLVVFNCITTRHLLQQKLLRDRQSRPPFSIRVFVTSEDPSAFSCVAHTSFIPPAIFPLGHYLLPSNLMQSPGGTAAMRLRASLLPPLAQMDGPSKPPMNQSEGCGKEGGRDRSSLLVAGAQAA